MNLSRGKERLAFTERKMTILINTAMNRGEIESIHSVTVSTVSLRCEGKRLKPLWAARLLDPTAIHRGVNESLSPGFRLFQLKGGVFRNQWHVDEMIGRRRGGELCGLACRDGFITGFRR